MSTPTYSLSEGRTRVMLWCTPRSSSTAFCRSMSGIPGIEIWNEPFGYANIAEVNTKKIEGVDLPREYEGNEEVYQRAAEHMKKVMGRPFYPQFLSYASIRKSLKERMATHVFVKDMSNGMNGKDVTQYIPSGYRHSFLIRHPVLVFASTHISYYKHFRSINRLLPEETDEATFDLRNHDELGAIADYFRNLYDTWEYIRTDVDSKAIVLDSTDLLSNPSGILPLYCKAMGLPYSQSLLQWTSGVEFIKSWKWGGDSREKMAPEIYHDNVISSECFSPPKAIPSRDQLPDDVIELSNAAMPFYEEMYKHRIGTIMEIETLYLNGGTK